MVLENDLESLDNGLEDTNEDLFRDDYLLDEDASGSGLQSAWTRMKYWFYRNRLKWTNNRIVINEGKDNRSNADLRRGIPLYELDANGQPIDTSFEDENEFALGTGLSSKVPWKLILRVLFGILVFTVFLILVINITKSDRPIKVLSHFGNPDLIRT